MPFRPLHQNFVVLYLANYLHVTGSGSTTQTLCQANFRQVPQGVSSKISGKRCVGFGENVANFSRQG